MEQHEHILGESSDLLRLVLAQPSESPVFPDAELVDGDEVATPSEELPYTDDPGTGLLEGDGICAPAYAAGGSRSGKAHGERGRLRVQSVLSRSPLVQRMVVAAYEEERQAEVKLENLVDINTSNEADRERCRCEATQRFQKMAKLNRELVGNREEARVDAAPPLPCASAAEWQAGPSKGHLLASDP
jgi:hypothetical protein